MSATLDQLDDTRIKAVRPLIPPAILHEDVPLSAFAAATVLSGRKSCEAILAGESDKLIVVVGPCSIHDTAAALEYAAKLSTYAKGAEADLQIVMRAYFEKPRTQVGWKGLINDPDLNGTFQINKGLRIGRKLLVQLNELGLPLACEYLDTISPQFIADCISWGAIGARTSESQVHRELASGLSMPIGYKNGTDGSLKIAIDAIRATSAPHSFLSVTKQGLAAIVETTGNPYTQIVLRGGSKGPNYSSEHVSACCKELTAAGIPQRIMVDCSHGNSSKMHARQIIVAADVSEQLSSAPHANAIMGVMLESNLVEGNQSIPEDPTKLVYGKSVTDACISWEDTVKTLDNLRAGVQARRANNAKNVSK